MIINNKRKEYKNKQMQINTSYDKDENISDNKKKTENIKVINGMGLNLDIKNKYQNGILSDEKSINLLGKNNNNSNSNCPIKIIKLNNINNFEVDGVSNNFDNQNGNKSNITHDSKYDSRRNFYIRNNSMKNINSKMVNSNFHNNVENVIFSNNNNIMLIDKNLSFNSERLDSRNAIKINKLKDDYIDYLQKEFEDKSKNNVQLDTSNKELLKKCNELILNNRLLNESLTDKNNKLTKISEENQYMKNEYNKSMANFRKMQEKTKVYEDQINLLKSNNTNNEKIIKELRQQIEQANSNLKKVKSEYEEKLKKTEEKYKNEIEENKKNMETLYNNKILDDDKNINNEKKIKSLMDEISYLKEKNQELIKDLETKEKTIELMYKDNAKLMNEANLKQGKLDQSYRQINDLKIILKHKESIINTFKMNIGENDRISLNKSNSCSFMKLDTSDVISENLTKLLNDNEENRMKLEVLNNRLKSIDEIRKKYHNLIKDNKAIPLTNNYSFNSRNSVNFTKEKLNTSFYSNCKNTNNKNNSQGEIDLKDNIENYNINKELNQSVRRSFLSSLSLNILNNSGIKNEENNNKNEKVIKKYIIDTSKDKDKDKDIKANILEGDKDKKPIISERFKSVEKKSIPFRGRNFYKRDENKNKRLLRQTTFENEENQKILHKRELEEESKDSRGSDEDSDKLKITTYVPKNFTFSGDEVIYEQNTEQIVNTTEGENNGSCYLYGIDRNDLFHIFDINNKIWLESKKIFDLNLDEKSSSFKTDYQYEGTLLYNTLRGVYILTGENTDTLYFFNSKSSSISKICKFNNSHNNGSMMFDNNENCLYVFGGKNITSCEYYSFYDRKVCKLPNLNIDRANSSFIISNNKIFAFFGFSYENDDYVRTIEYIDYNKKDKWIELNNITLLKNDISFDVESVSTMYYKQNASKILIYSGIQGEDEDFITEYYLIYDVRSNTMDKINKWNIKQYKNIGKKWKDYEITGNDPKGFHFAKNSRFILLPDNCIPEGYNENDIIEVLIDYKNNVHFIVQEKNKIDVYRGEM